MKEIGASKWVSRFMFILSVYPIEFFPNLNDSIKNLVYDMDDINIWCKHSINYRCNTYIQ